MLQVRAWLKAILDNHICSANVVFFWHHCVKPTGNHLKHLCPDADLNQKVY